MVVDINGCCVMFGVRGIYVYCRLVVLQRILTIVLCFSVSGEFFFCSFDMRLPSVVIVSNVYMLIYILLRNNQVPNFLTMFIY